MASYLDRYQQGEREQVWQELTALGDQVYEERLYADAYAVATETMRRARQNIELLIARLRKLGYAFEFPDDVFTPPEAELLEDMVLFEKVVGRVPLSVRAWVEQVGTVNFIGTYPRLSSYDSSPPMMQMGNQSIRIDSIDMDDMLEQLNAADAIPENVRNMFSSFFQNVDIRNALKDASLSEEPFADEDQVESDPLCVDFSELSVDSYQEWQEYNADIPFQVEISPDILHKANISGGDGYAIIMPQAVMDAPLLNTNWREFTFVEYLRFSFEWAGFPGLHEYDNADEKLLASLKEGLLLL